MTELRERVRVFVEDHPEGVGLRDIERALGSECDDALELWAALQMLEHRGQIVWWKRFFPT